jgi:hypothetical protein
LREHAAWALAQFKTSQARLAIEKLLAHENNDQVKAQMQEHLASAI